MTKVELVKNLGYKWTACEDTYFKGYFQYQNSNNDVFSGISAVKELACVDNIESFVAFLKKIDGVYAIIIRMHGEVYAAVDRARSMPLYYHSDGSIISDSSEHIRKQFGISREGVDPYAFLALFSSDYVIANDTVYSNIKQIDLGQLAIFDTKGVHLHNYFHHISKIADDDNARLRESLTDITSAVFERISKAINGRPVVLSMSGGYDSRLVGCMLKRSGIHDVSCYTYGKSDSFEVKQSKQNADVLGFRWTCVEHTDARIKSILYDENQPYFDFCCEHDYIIFLQNYVAVKHLHESNWIKPGSVFITGLCGDMPTGNYIKPLCETNINEFSSRSVAESLYRQVFTRYQLDSASKTFFIEKLTSMADALPIRVSDYQSYTSAIDCLLTGFCHSRAFLHMNRVHEYFGYEWLLPYWDSIILQKWYSIPAHKRARQALYEEWLLNDICAPYGIGSKKFRSVYSNSKIKKKLMYLGGGIAACILYNIGVPFRRKYDYNNFATLESELFKRISSRKAIKYKKAGLPLLLNRYVLQERYGNNAILNAWERIVE